MQKKPEFSIRFARKEDAVIILDFIKKLAKYEKMTNDVVASVEHIEKTIFEQHEAEVIIAEEDSVPIGFALFFKTYSTFLGKANYYLEDLFINKDKRGLGYGKEMLSFLANIVVKNGASRLEWICLDWNQPSIDFYESIGATPLSSWTTYRLSGDALHSLSNINPD